MIVFIDIYRKIIKYNFVTLIAADIFQLHFHLHRHFHSGVLLLSQLSNTFWLFKISFPVIPYYIQPSYNNASLTASWITNSQTQSFVSYKVKFL